MCCRRGGVSGRGGPAWSHSCHGAADRQMPPPCPLHGLEGTDASGVGEPLHRGLYLQVSDGAKTVKLHQGHFPLKKTPLKCFRRPVYVPLQRHSAIIHSGIKQHFRPSNQVLMDQFTKSCFGKKIGCECCFVLRKIYFLKISEI